MIATVTGTNNLATTTPVSRLSNGGAEHGPLGLYVPHRPWNVFEALPENGRSIPPNHTPPGLNVIVNVSFEVPQENKGIPRRGALQHPLQGLRKGGAKMGGNKYAHPSSVPLTKGNSRVEECPTPLKETDSRVTARGDIPCPKSQLLQPRIRPPRSPPSAGTNITLHPTPLASPTGGEQIGRGTHISSSGCARPGSVGESPATRRSPVCPNSTPGPSGATVTCIRARSVTRDGLISVSYSNGGNLNHQSNTAQLQNKKKHLKRAKRDLENQKDNTTETDHYSIVKYALPSCVVGMVIGVLIPIITCTRIYRCKKSKQPRTQDGDNSDHSDNSGGGGVNEGDDGAVIDGGDEREPFLVTRNQTGENLNQQRNTEQLQNKEKHLKGGKKELENYKDENSKLQRNLEQLQDVNKQLLDTQNEVKNLLENQKDHLAKRLQDVETKREKNKEELKLVEKTINETTTFDEKELVLKQKEELLQSQWKLDEEKKNYERQLLFIERLLEPIDIQMMRITKRNGNL
ncbi:hypothetical protein ILYODFUR_022966 [Ilyodon furcidens]|uniref:Uncharacterized protein n=1 Tax=Ilyodon furcidens TaxID=33524 RepID=A0ABV0UIF3_9TELE